jgi:mRNA interferase MazF
MNQLDVVLVAIPFSDLSATKTRPALIVSGPQFNNGSDVVVCAITSNLARTREPNMLLTNADFVKGGLPVPSVVRFGWPMRIERTIIRKKLGTLSGTRTKTVREGINALLA